MVLHAVVAPWLISRSAAGSTAHRADALPIQNPPPPESERTRLGIERSEHATINWLGFSDPTRHRALVSEIEQAALSVAPVGIPGEPSPAEASESSEATAVVEPEAAPPVEIPTEQPTESPAPTEPTPTGGAKVIELLPADDPLTLAERETGDFLPEPVETRTAEATLPPPPPPSTEPTETATTPTESPANQTPTAVQPAAPSGSDDQPGLPSDRESSPTAREAALTIDDWGKPAAGEGIEIIPRRPRWGATVASLAWPRNPTVIIAFGRDGTARDVRFATEGKRVLNTGSEEVDRILLNAVYNWRAKGAKIESLAEEGSGSLFTIRVHIRLRW